MTEQNQDPDIAVDVDAADDEGMESPDELPGGPKSPPVDGNIDLIMQIPLSVDVVLGSATMSVSRLMKLGRGSVVALDRKVGEPVELVVSGRVIARGQMMLLEDGSSRFGLSLTEIVQPVNPVEGLRNAE